jgi:uncharacterized RDD family membrane protein YckC
MSSAGAPSAFPRRWYVRALAGIALAAVSPLILAAVVQLELGWLFLLTFPLAGLMLVIWLIVLIIHRAWWNGRANRDPDAPSQARRQSFWSARIR